MTDRDLIALIAREIAPNPWFRRDRALRLGRGVKGLLPRDYDRLAASERLAERIAKAMRKAGALAQ